MFDSPLVETTIDLVLGFISLLIVSRIIRKTQINQISPFDFISTIVLGELLGNAVYDDTVKGWHVVYALVVWVSLMFIVEMVTLKFRRTRKIIEGEPAIIIRNGKIDYNVIKKEKLDINELLSIIRQKDIFSLREIEIGILEQSGNISILRKSEYDSPNAKDLSLPKKEVYISTSIILDGEILKQNLESIGFDEDWLMKQLKKYGVSKVEDVFYAEWKKDEGIHIVTKNIETSKS